MSLTVGPRYAFFSNHGTSPEYQYAMSVGSGYLSNLKNQLTNTINNDINGHHLNKIQTYIKFIGEIANTAKANEIYFIQRVNQLYDENYLGSDLKNHINILLEGINNGNFDYIKLISVITDFIHLNDEHYKERDEIYETNMEIITKNYKSIEAMANFSSFWRNIYDRINYEYIHNYSKYRALVMKYLTTPIINDKKIRKTFNSKSVTTLISDKFQSMMTNLSNSNELISLIKEQAISTGLNADSIMEFLITMALKWISSLSYTELKDKSGKDLANLFSDEIQKNYKQMAKEINQTLVDNTLALINKGSKEIKTFEEIALTTGHNLIKMFQQLDQDSKNKLLKLENLNELYNDGKILETASGEKKFKIAIQNAIRNTFNKNGFIKPEGDSSIIRKAVNAFIEKHSDIVGFTGIQQQIKHFFNVKTNGGAIGEYLALNVPELMKAITAGGGEIKFKTDMSVTITWNENLKFDFIDEKQEQELIKAIENFIPNLLQEMKNENLAKKNKAEQTDVDVAINSYLKIMTDIQNKINKLKSTDKNNEEQKKKLLTQLSNFFTESISVKDYDAYNNELGVHGGSLGGGNRSINIINNISKMYELGGISTIDKNLLMFGAINCANGMIANGIEEDLATYLLGGAAIIMFDDGFTDIEKFFNKIKSDFGFAMKPLHLYRVQGKIIPASYIYSTIYNNLNNLYPQLEQDMSLKTLNSSKCQVNIINNASYGDIETEGTLQERWDKTAIKVQKQVSITFSFMGGLLDIFRAIPNAFNDIT